MKVSLQYLVIKPLHAKWIVDLYNFLKNDKENIRNDFSAVGIPAAFKDVVQSFLTLPLKS